MDDIHPVFLEILTLVMKVCSTTLEGYSSGAALFGWNDLIFYQEIGLSIADFFVGRPHDELSEARNLDRSQAFRTLPQGVGRR